MNYYTEKELKKILKKDYKDYNLMMFQNIYHNCFENNELIKKVKIMLKVNLIINLMFLILMMLLLGTNIYQKNDKSNSVDNVYPCKEHSNDH